MDFKRVELDEGEVVEYEVEGENYELMEDFAFEVYQQQNQISAKRYVSGVDRYVAWLELMADRAERKDYPTEPLKADSGVAYDYFSWLSNTDWAVNTRESYFAAVQRFYRWVEQSARGEDITEPHSIDDFELDAGNLDRELEQQKYEKAIPRSDVEQLWHADNIPSPRTRNELAFKLLWYTTMRTRALAEVKIDNIDRENGVIVIPNLKPGDDDAPFREVVYPPERLEPLLREWLDRGKRASLGPHAGSPYLLVTHQSPQMRPSHISRLVKDAARNAGLNEVTGEDVRGRQRWKVTGHTIRHSSITYLANKTDVPIHFVKRQAGHSKLETTLSYVQDDDDEFQRRLKQSWE